MTLQTTSIQTAAPGVGAACGTALVYHDHPIEGLLFFAASMAVYAYVQRRPP